jgi:methylmalonyl-CoA mutase, C-terminal domain
VAESGVKGRIVLAKLGLDGHDRGVRMLARELRVRGVEVILLGTGVNPMEIAATAVQEDAQAIGISMLSGAHMTLLPLLLEELRKEEVEIPVVAGGTINEADAAELRREGVLEVCSVGTSVGDAAQAMIDAAQGEARECSGAAR